MEASIKHILVETIKHLDLAYILVRSTRGAAFYVRSVLLANIIYTYIHTYTIDIIIIARSSDLSVVVSLGN